MGRCSKDIVIQDTDKHFAMWPIWRTVFKNKIGGLALNCSNSSALAMELLQLVLISHRCDTICFEIEGQETSLSRGGSAK